MKHTKAGQNKLDKIRFDKFESFCSLVYESCPTKATAIMGKFRAYADAKIRADRYFRKRYSIT